MAFTATFLCCATATLCWMRSPWRMPRHTRPARTTRWRVASVGTRIGPRSKACAPTSPQMRRHGVMGAHAGPGRSAWRRRACWWEAVRFDSRTTIRPDVLVGFPNYRRQGIASRAVRLVANYAFGPLGICPLEAFIALDNSGSRGVARNAGFSSADLVLDGEQPMLRHVLRSTGAGASDGEWRTRDS
jgi:Acetyltransferase (GNAT) domain